MANVRTLQRSFAGGELSPEMYGRIDDVKYQTGLATCRNFITKPQGPAENRPGFAYVSAVKDSSKATRLIPFTYSTTQTMVIEVGAGYFRFHTQGATLLSGTPSAWQTGTGYVIGDMATNSGTKYYCTTAHTSGTFATDLAAGKWYAMPATVYEIPNPYAEADLFDIHYVQSADVLTLVHHGYAPRELRRYGATNWQLFSVLFAPSLSPPSLSVTGNAKGTQYFYQYVVTSISADFVSESAASGAAQGVARSISSVTKANPGVLTTSVNHGLSTGNSVYIASCGGMTELNDNYYVVNSVPAANTLTLEDAAGNVIDTTAFNAYTSGGKLYLSGVKNNLFVTGGANTITWAPVNGAAFYNVYKFQGGVYGYIGRTSGSSFVDDNISPDLGVTPPTYETVFNTAGEYPGSVSYFEQRRCFAGSTNKPQNIWMTRSGTESAMSYSTPIKDDDRISFKIAAREANTIRHIVPLNELLLLTSSAEWRVTSVNSDAITPTTISVKPQSYVGASNVQPVIINNSLIYGAARGGHIREMGYNWQANGFVSGDLSLRASHLFDGDSIVDMAYSKAPTPIVWFVTGSGKLLGLTYVPEQQIGAWHQHDTDGEFESCTVVAEGDEDVLYVIAKRTINSATVRYIERIASRLFEDQEDAFFVDCGGTWNGTNDSAITMTVSGGTTWGADETLTITASSASFDHAGGTDIGDCVVLINTDGEKYRLTIDATTSTSIATGRIDRTLPAALRGAATTSWAWARGSVSGLTWLEGKTVSILADGSVHPQRTVTSGAITLDRPTSVVQVGLPITADLKTLPMAMQIDNAFGQGRVKNANKIWLRVNRSSGIFAGQSFDKLTEFKQRTIEPYGSPPALKSDEISLVVSPSWENAGGQVCIRQIDPLPLSIVSMTVEVSAGG